MSKVNPGSVVAFVEVSCSVKPSGSQHSSPAFDRRFLDRVPAKSAPGDEAVMVRCLAENASRIYLATEAMDFRKQISGLIAIVSMQFKRNPF